MSEKELLEARRARLAELRASGWDYPNDFRRDATADELLREYGERSREELERDAPRVRVAGRMVLRRLMGRAAFLHLQDGSGRIQLHARRDLLGETAYADFKRWDLGDLCGAVGTLFRTRTGELTVAAEQLLLLSKAVRPPPEKHHGLADRELRYRRRYLDLLYNEEVRRVFTLRALLLRTLRARLTEQGFTEVETPMMHPIPGGAAARPFSTRHNALGIKLYLRVAPELYLKRLLVGGLERVFELNRCFRNEGLSTRHNPEFTMLELYQAYAACADMMGRVEELLRELSRAVRNAAHAPESPPNWEAPFRRLELREALLEHNPGLRPSDLDDAERLSEALRGHGGDPESGRKTGPEVGTARLELELFERTVEKRLLEPTFVTGYPLEVSPLARRSDAQPERAERFECFINGLEIANGFSELNDPEEQARRFLAQARLKEGSGNDDAGEVMHYDAEYITALEYGMPPAAGAGLGIDRLVMLLTGMDSIRDVLLFPQLRPLGNP